MARYPSVDTIEQRTGYDRDVCIKVRRIIDGRDDPRSLPGVQAWIASCFHEPTNDVELKLAAISELMWDGDCHMDESIRSERAHDRYWMDTLAKYVNVGDSYYGTIIYDVERDLWLCESTAEFTEKARRRGHQG